MMINTEATQVAFRAVNHISAMVAYWDINQTCVFSNDAYRQWFGKTPEQMRGMTILELLGAELYEKNLPYILSALKGEKQTFERRLLDFQGVTREVIFTYTPDVIDSGVWGFTTHGADVTALREREAALEKAIRGWESAQTELRILRGLLPICGFCKSIRDDHDQWQQLEQYVSCHSEATFTHGICPHCKEKHYGKFLQET